MNDKASELGCKAGDMSCLCDTDNYKFGIRDCTTQACPKEDAQAVLSNAVSKCPGGKAGEGSQSGSGSGSGGASGTNTAGGAGSTGDSTAGAGGAGSTGTGAMTGTMTGGVGATGTMTGTGAGGASATGTGASGMVSYNPFHVPACSNCFRPRAPWVPVLLPWPPPWRPPLALALAPARPALAALAVHLRLAPAPAPRAPRALGTARPPRALALRRPARPAARRLRELLPSCRSAMAPSVRLALLLCLCCNWMTG